MRASDWRHNARRTLARNPPNLTVGLETELPMNLT